MSIGNKIKSLRLQNKITQDELGKYLGVQRSAVANYESGKRAVDMKTCEKIATYFNITLDHLTGNEKDTSKDFVYNAKAYFLSDNITQVEKDEVVKAVMDYYFESKAVKYDQTKGGEPNK